MNEKKTTILTGTLLMPLSVGSCAIFQHNGQTVRTSRVVAITDVSSNSISFETMNTNYKLLAPAVEQVISVPVPMGAAA